MQYNDHYNIIFQLFPNWQIDLILIYEKKKINE